MLFDYFQVWHCCADTV